MLFSRRRLQEWRAALADEGERGSVAALWLHILYVGACGIWRIRQRRRGWRRKMRTCLTCPLFDRYSKVCRPPLRPELGCGCYTPYMALFEDQCWGDTHLHPSDNIGWERRRDHGQKTEAAEDRRAQAGA
jgi:hypothetical protein